MSRGKLTLVRGLPGVGKSTYAARQPGAIVLSADDYFMTERGYEFNPALIGEAHKWCQDSARALLERGTSVIVANTFTQRWEMQVYLEMPYKALEVIDLFDGGFSATALARRNVHGVPESTIQGMRARYEHAWWDGNPLPPWER